MTTSYGCQRITAHFCGQLCSHIEKGIGQTDDRTLLRGHWQEALYKNRNNTYINVENVVVLRVTARQTDIVTTIGLPPTPLSQI